LGGDSEKGNFKGKRIPGSERLVRDCRKGSLHRRSRPGEGKEVQRGLERGGKNIIIGEEASEVLFRGRINLLFFKLRRGKREIFLSSGGGRKRGKKAFLRNYLR